MADACPPEPVPVPRPRRPRHRLPAPAAVRAIFWNAAASEVMVGDGQYGPRYTVVAAWPESHRQRRDDITYPMIVTKVGEEEAPTQQYQVQLHIWKLRSPHRGWRPRDLVTLAFHRAFPRGEYFSPYVTTHPWGKAVTEILALSGPELEAELALAVLAGGRT